MWRETVDFVRMASRLNAVIVPFGILLPTLHHFLIGNLCNSSPSIIQLQSSVEGSSRLYF
jgi:hypothetical protein